MAGKAVIVQRDGKDWVTVRDPFVSTQVSNFKAYFSYDNAIASPILGQACGIINSNWRLMKPMIDPAINKVIVEVLTDVVTPMFNAIPMQTFFKM